MASYRARRLSLRRVIERTVTGRIELKIYVKAWLADAGNEHCASKAVAEASKRNDETDSYVVSREVRHLVLW